MSVDLADGPLQGLKVLKLGQLLAGPYVGTLLGDFGAEVIKIEPPPKGDAMRDWGRLRHHDHSGGQLRRVARRPDRGRRVAGRRARP